MTLLTDTDAFDPLESLRLALFPRVPVRDAIVVIGDSRKPLRSIMKERLRARLEMERHI